MPASPPSDDPLPPPDCHIFNAARGWLELGSAVEAETELHLLSTAALARPEVLELRWQILSQLERWEDAVAVAVTLMRAAPELCAGWVDRSFALHELKRTQEAWDCLLPAAGIFPTVGIIPYNLACYACQLGRLEEAQEWLGQAVALLGRAPVKQMGLSDGDLKPLRAKLRKL